MLRRRIPQSGHLMTAKRFWLQTVPSEVAIMLQEFPFPWKKMTMVVMILVTDMFRIVTLCWPSRLTPLKQPWSGSERGFTGFRYDLCFTGWNDISTALSGQSALFQWQFFCQLLPLRVKKMPLVSKISSHRQTFTYEPHFCCRSWQWWLEAWTFLNSEENWSPAILFKSPAPQLRKIIISL